MATGGLEAIPPPDDAGSETMARYHYQAELTTQHCLAMIVNGGVERIICEFHEDYVLYMTGALQKLVSIKHLEESQPRWTTRGLCEDGGLLHLFGRWRAAGEDATCLLRTNTELRPGNAEPGGLKVACHSGEQEPLSQWADRLLPIFNEMLAAKAQPETTADEIDRFLHAVRFDDGLPKRTEVRSHNLINLMPAVVAHLGRSAQESEAIYEQIVAEVDRACRSESSRSILDVLADLANPDRHEAFAELAALVEAKSLDRSRLLRCLVRRQAATAVGLHPLDPAPVRLVAKLQRGGFGPTAISHARNLRIAWESHRRRWTSDLPIVGDDFQSVAAQVLEAAHDAERRAREAALPTYGLGMLDELKIELESRALALPGSDPADVGLLLGCAYALTEECRVWWSDEFKIEEAPA